MLKPICQLHMVCNRNPHTHHYPDHTYPEKCPPFSRHLRTATQNNQTIRTPPPLLRPIPPHPPYPPPPHTHTHTHIDIQSKSKNSLPSSHTDIPYKDTGICLIDILYIDRENKAFSDHDFQPWAPNNALKTPTEENRYRRVFIFHRDSKYTVRCLGHKSLSGYRPILKQPQAIT